MAQRKSFLLRLPPELQDELNRWAKDELRSLNAQIEYLLREAIRSAERKTSTRANPNRDVSFKDTIRR
ncbi:MAG: toxin-antitoxin system HicB family antitoxin [Planctomycetes bacterium]|nr:toxin-antitoxin system HicB family antitoxin [Planctomycetota bacterium]